MRKLIPLLAVTFVFAGLVAARVLAAEEKTIVGDGKCAKCALKETKSCQNVVQVNEAGKTVTYYLEKNDVAKAFHKNVCMETRRVKATGTVEDKDGKKVMTASKIEVVEE